MSDSGLTKTAWPCDQALGRGVSPASVGRGAWRQSPGGGGGPAWGLETGRLGSGPVCRRVFCPADGHWPGPCAQHGTVCHCLLWSYVSEHLTAVSSSFLLNNTWISPTRTARSPWPRKDKRDPCRPCPVLRGHSGCHPGSNSLHIPLKSDAYATPPDGSWPPGPRFLPSWLWPGAAVPCPGRLGANGLPPLVPSGSHRPVWKTGTEP